MNRPTYETLSVRLAALEIENRMLHETVLASEIALAGSRAETKVGVTDLLASVAALAASRAETKVGVADLLASVAALATSRAETQIGVADLLASVTALARSRAETKHGVADLLASETALASSQAETKSGVADLLASDTALATSRAETQIGFADLLASVAALAASRAETKVGVADLLASVTALATSRAETQIGVADLLASETALASSQAEAKIGVADLLASVTALAAARAETKVGVADLLASEIALASAQAETKIGVADLLASVTALATSRAETKIGVADLLASETANTGLETLARELAQARDAAVRANRAKSRFLAGMSHELRTPLHGVLGYAQLLRRDGDLNEVQLARVTAMLGAGMHLLEMIEGVLDLSEIEAGRVELRVAEVDLRHVADACLDLVRPTAEGKQLALSLSVALDVPLHLTTDPKRLRQVLFNLLGNAVKYTLQGAVELRIRIAEEGANLRFEVADTGPGIPAEHHDRLFQEFARLDADPTSTVEGAGLGLSLSKQLATLMGGRVGHDANPGGGSIFWLELPLMRYDEAAPNPAAALDVGNAPPPRNLRVLVVDDVAMNLDIAAAFIRSAGHDVTCVDSGIAAIEAVKSTEFDVVMMDVRMPEMDGLEATRRIRAVEAGRGHLPIVAMTAQVFSEQMEECRKAGMDGHLAKPFTLDSLLDALASSQVGAKS